MITKKIFYSLLVVGAIALSSCQKDLDLFVPDPIIGPDTTWYNNISAGMPVASLKNDLLLDIHKDSFVINNSPVAVMANSGLVCVFYAGSLMNSSGQPVAGNIHLESYLLKKKGDMIRMGTPTTSNGRVLVSGGELFVRLLKDGNELQLSQNSHVNISYPDTGISQAMKLFYGDATSPEFNWLPNQDTSNWITGTTVQSYQLLTNRLQWINCDHFYDTTGIPQTIVSAVLPSNYTNANTGAYIVFNDIRSVTGMYGNAATRKFSSGRLPAGQSITMVIISKQGDNYFLGHQQEIIVGSPGAVGAQQITVTPVITSLDNIKAYLDTL